MKGSVITDESIVALSQEGEWFFQIQRMRYFPLRVHRLMTEHVTLNNRLPCVLTGKTLMRASHQHTVQMLIDAVMGKTH